MNRRDEHRGEALVSGYSGVRTFALKRLIDQRIPTSQTTHEDGDETTELSNYAREPEEHMVTGILIRAGEKRGDELRKVLIDGSFEGIAEAINGERAEPVYVRGCHFYRAVGAKSDGKVPNLMATRIAQTLGWLKRGVVYGDVIFLDEDAEGNEASLPEELAQIIIQIALGR